jgi:hypothetical protein
LRGAVGVEASFRSGVLHPSTLSWLCRWLYHHTLAPCALFVFISKYKPFYLFSILMGVLRKETE